MSANVDQQRSKGQPPQVSISGKDGMKSDDPYLQQPPPQHPMRSWSEQTSDATYGAAPMSNAGVSDNFFQPSYYNPGMSYPFMSQGVSSTEGPWSNGADTMFNMGYDYNMYGGFGFPFNNWEYPSDYWGQSQPVRKDQRGVYPGEETYYTPEMMPPDSYGMMNGVVSQHEAQEPIGTVEQGLRNMSIGPAAVHANEGTTRKKVVELSQQPGTPDGFPNDSLMMQPPPPPSVPQSHQSNSVLGVGNGNINSNGPSAVPKKTSWAAVASQPARNQQQIRPRTIPRAPVNPNKPHNMDIGTWDGRGAPKGYLPPPQNPPSQPSRAQQSWTSPPARSAHAQPHSIGGSGDVSVSLNSNNNNSGSVSNSGNNSNGGGANNNNVSSSGNDQAYSNIGKRFVFSNAVNSSNGEHQQQQVAPASKSTESVSLKNPHLYNPKEFNLNPKSARFFIIKSYSEDDIHRSIKYSIWCSTEHGNKRLDVAFREREGKGPVYLIFSVNGSGHFCGIAQMMTPVDYNKSAGVWAQDKWKGQFEVKWLYVKDIPNSQLRHIRLENNENKPVTNSRDTQEVPLEKGKQVLRIVHSYKHQTSIFDDFIHYEKRLEEDQHTTQPPPHSQQRDQRNEHHRGGERDNRGEGRGGRDNRDNRDHYHHHRSDYEERDNRDRDHRGDRGDHRGGGGFGGDRGGDRNRENRRHNGRQN